MKLCLHKPQRRQILHQRWGEDQHASKAIFKVTYLSFHHGASIIQFRWIETPSCYFPKRFSPFVSDCPSHMQGLLLYSSQRFRPLGFSLFLLKSCPPTAITETYQKVLLQSQKFLKKYSCSLRLLLSFLHAILGMCRNAPSRVCAEKMLALKKKEKMHQFNMDGWKKCLIYSTVLNPLLSFALSPSSKEWIFSDPLIRQQDKCLSITSFSTGSQITIEACNQKDGRQVLHHPNSALFISCCRHCCCSGTPFKNGFGQSGLMAVHLW